jgi:hypothetical protein
MLRHRREGYVEFVRQFLGRAFPDTEQVQESPSVGISNGTKDVRRVILGHHARDYS